jgi:cytochrome b involved in lipid metabolism
MQAHGVSSITHAPQGCPFQSAADPTTRATDGEQNNITSSSTGCPWRSRYERPKSTVADVKLSRRQLRQLDRAWCMEDVKKHRFADDAWIAVNGKVYDITEHIITHPGWHSAGISTVLSILSHSGMDCTPEFTEIHRPYPIAWRQLQAFYIGELQQDASDVGSCDSLSSLGM